jgi:RHS repeat-associated protein
MTPLATCAIGEFPCNSSHYRAEQFDSDLGLYYLRARYYNPATGRFLSRDPKEGNPSDPKSLHKYLYAGGNPVSALDPTGRASILETGAIDVDLVSEVIHPIVKLTCLAEILWASAATATKAISKYAFDREKEPIPPPPLWLDSICAVVLGPDAVKALFDYYLENFAPATFE